MNNKWLRYHTITIWVNWVVALATLALWRWMLVDFVKLTERK